MIAEPSRVNEAQLGKACTVLLEPLSERQKRVICELGTFGGFLHLGPREYTSRNGTTRLRVAFPPRLTFYRLFTDYKDVFEMTQALHRARSKMETH